jgi:hypothetical protein
MVVMSWNLFLTKNEYIKRYSSWVNMNSHMMEGFDVLALRVTLRLREDKPNTHQIFWWMLVLYEWRSMDKTQNMNDVQHKNGQEMHREVRPTLTSVSELSLIMSRGKT